MSGEEASLPSHLESKRHLAVRIVSPEGTPQENYLLTYLSQTQAFALDQRLFELFSLDQLMELAGLAVSHAAVAAIPRESRSLLVVCGPGNNGGDGLVAARHLVSLGQRHIRVLYPKKSAEKPLFRRLLLQLQACQPEVEVILFDLTSGIDGASSISNFLTPYFSDAHSILDCVFGFSFKGWRGEGQDSPFDVLCALVEKNCERVLAVDVPSGWRVDEKNTSKWQPGLGLVSLTLPKLCAEGLRTPHWVGGRFLPNEVQKEWGLHLPAYRGIEMVQRISES